MTEGGKASTGDKHTSISSPVSVAVHEYELESDETIEVWVIVPGRFVQKEDVPVGGDKHEAGKAVETTKHDPQRPCI